MSRRPKPPESASGVGPARAGLELVWPGKYDTEGRRCPVPRVHPRMELVEAYGDAQQIDRLIIGDNLLALDALAEREAGTVDLAVVDPPFGTGGRFEVQTRVGGKRADGKAAILRRPAYGDRWPGGTAGLVAMLDPRLRLLHALLSPTGSLYVHLDATVVHAVKLVLDEIFGPECFQRQIVWRIGWISGFKSRAHNWIRNHDVILFYTKHPTDFCFNKAYVPHPPEYRRRDGNPARAPGMPISDVWNASDVEAALEGEASLDSIQIKSFSGEKTGYATQKNESLLRRIVEASSRPGDLVADVFCGSGTTLAVARKLGRRALGCDTGRAAIHIARRRLLGIPSERGLQVWSLEGHEPAMSGPRIEASLHGLEAGRLRVHLHGVHDPAPIPELAALEPSPLDLVDAWAVQWQAEDDVLRADLWLPRHHDRRTLEIEAGPHMYVGPGPWRLRIAVFDVLHRRATLEIDLCRAGEGIAVVDPIDR